MSDSGGSLFVVLTAQDRGLCDMCDKFKAVLVLINKSLS